MYINFHWNLRISTPNNSRHFGNRVRLMGTFKRECGSCDTSLRHFNGLGAITLVQKIRNLFSCCLQGEDAIFKSSSSIFSQILITVDNWGLHWSCSLLITSMYTEGRDNRNTKTVNNIIKYESKLKSYVIIHLWLVWNLYLYR